MRVAIGNATFDSERRQLLRGAEEVRLSPKAFSLLAALLEARPRALSKTELCEALWPDTFVVEANLANLVKEVRDALGDDARKQRFVRTVHRYGYAFAAETAAAQREPEHEGGLVFRVVSGKTEFDLRPGENVFGRDLHASIWLSDESVSRSHARIVVAGGQATLEDLGSKNGTFHRGTRIAAKVVLADGDDIAIGHVPMTFRRVATAASTVTRTGAIGHGA